MDMREQIFQQFCFDFYGELLSERQKIILDYVYNEDYSLSEVAQIIGVTRQGVHDAYHRAQKRMAEYEEKLGLVTRFMAQQDLLREVNMEIMALLSDETVRHNAELYGEIKKLQLHIDAIIEGI